MKARQFVAIGIVGVLVLGADECRAQNPYLEVVDALVGDNSLFNGPDRTGGADTLHGEVDAHWWEDDPEWGDYVAIDIYSNSENTWPDVDVPKWEFNGDTFPITPINPEIPQWEEEDDLSFEGEPDIHVVTGRFLTGAVLWPHEEYVEQFANTELEELDEDHMVPVYWICHYYLFIPAEYADPSPTDLRGRALIVYGAGHHYNAPPPTPPPWLTLQLSDGTNLTNPDTWLNNAGVLSCRRLRVPVMVITVMPNRKNTWLKSDDGNNPQGGVTGYDSEGHVFFPTEWAAKQFDQGDPELITMHPQYMYAASFIRARTFLDGFFNPTTQMGTADWSQWDEITQEDTDRYTQINDVIIQGASKRGYATWIAGVADPSIKAIISNGMGNLHLEQQNRLAIDEKWETNRQDRPPGDEYDPEGPETNQVIPTSGMQSRARFFGELYRGETEKFRHYSVFDIFKNRDVMKDSEHTGNPQPEIRVYNVQGAQDPFWGRNSWVNWFEDDVFHGAHQYLELNPFAVHPPYYAEFTRSMQSFCESVWFGRPMPQVSITDIEYNWPFGEETTPPDLVVRARFQIDDISNWPLKDYGGEFDPDDPQNFKMRLCVGLRPVSAEFSRGMWSDFKPLGSADRSTPWWEIAPTDVSVVSMGIDTVAYDVKFFFKSDAYDDVNREDVPGFGESGTLDISGVPPGFHIAFYVHAGVEHEDSQHAGEAYPVRVSSVIEYLPPWGVGPPQVVYPEVD